MTNRIKVLRAEKDWSQAQLAEELGVSRQTINAIETSKYDASLPLAFDLARIFGKRIEEIFLPEPRTMAKAKPNESQPAPELDISLI